MWGCFDNCVYLSVFDLSVLVYGLLPPSDNSIAVNNNNNTSNNNNNNNKVLDAAFHLSCPLLFSYCTISLIVSYNIMVFI